MKSIRRISIYVWSFIMIILAATAMIRGYSSLCIFMCGLSLSANCMQEILERKMRTGIIWYLMVLCSVIAGIVVNPILPCIIPFMIFAGLNIHGFLIKRKQIVER